jgi:group I intron endonuclease
MITYTQGIYKIVNCINNKYYLGSSKHIEKRFKEHIKLLNKNLHHCKHLQSAWNLYGEESFKFTIIENLNNIEIDKIRIIEQFYLDSIIDWTEVYNTAKDVNKINLNISPTKETREKISISLKGRKQSEQTRQKISNALKGTIFSKERKEKISKSKLGHKTSQETKEKIRQGNKNKSISDHAKQVARDIRLGIPLSKNTKEKISLANKKSGSSVYFNKSKNKWTSSIFLNGKNKCLGHFNSYEEALNARLEAEKKYW